MLYHIMKWKIKTAVNFKANLIASRELFHINDSSDMTNMIDHLLC